MSYTQKHPYFSLSLAEHTPPPTVWTSGPPLQCTPFVLLSYFTAFTDNYRPQNSTEHKHSSPRPPSAGCQQSQIVRIHPSSSSLLFQLSTHGRTLTSTILLKTVRWWQTEGERCQRAHTLKNLPMAWTIACKWKHMEIWAVRLVIGVVWLLAEASWLHSLTLISEKPNSASSHCSTESTGSLLSRPFTSFIILALYFTLISGFSASVASVLFTRLTPAPPPPDQEKSWFCQKQIT